MQQLSPTHVGLKRTINRRPLENTKYNKQIPNIAYHINDIVFFWKEHFNRRGTPYGVILSFSGWSCDEMRVFLAYERRVLPAYERRVFPAYDKLSCTGNLDKNMRNMIFGWRIIISGHITIHILSLCFYYSQYISYFFVPCPYVCFFHKSCW